jgi:hypothetical protein
LKDVQATSSPLADTFERIQTVNHPVSRDTATTAWVAVLMSFALVPVLLVDIPAMGDYVNHLARMYLLAMRTVAKNSFYQVEWNLNPNQAMDLVVPQMARVMNVEAATKLFLIASQLLMVSGAVAVEWAIKRRHQLAGFAAVSVLYCTPFTWGLTNFQFGLAGALWGIACWLFLQHRKWHIRLGCHSIFVIVIFLSHVFALGIYIVTIGIYELWRTRSQSLQMKQIILTALIVGGPPAILIALTILSEGRIGGSETEWSLAGKLIWPLRFMSEYNLQLSLLSLILVVCVWLVLRATNALRISALGKWMGAGYLVLYLAMPWRLFGSAFDDIRVICAAALVLPAVISFTPQARWQFYLCGFAATIISLSLTANVSVVWLSYQDEYARMKLSFACIKHGSTILIGRSEEATSDLTEFPIYYAPTLAVHYAGALVSSFYTVPTHRSVRLRDEFRRFEVDDGLQYLPVPVQKLKVIVEGRQPFDVPVYAYHWYRDFDYLYLVGRSIPNPMPELLHELFAGGRFTLYRIDK